MLCPAKFYAQYVQPPAFGKIFRRKKYPLYITQRASWKLNCIQEFLAKVFKSWPFSLRHPAYFHTNCNFRCQSRPKSKE